MSRATYRQTALYGFARAWMICSDQAIRLYRYLADGDGMAFMHGAVPIMSPCSGVINIYPNKASVKKKALSWLVGCKNLIQAKRRHPYEGIAHWPGIRRVKRSPPGLKVQRIAGIILKYRVLGARPNLHGYVTGEHDFGVRDNDTLPSSWRQLCLNWLRSRNLLLASR